MDWQAWARRAEEAIDMRRSPGDGGVVWRELFAEDAEFGDPATSSTTDLGAIAHDTRDVFPDWHQQITWIRGGDDWAVFEWVGRATYKGGPQEGVTGSGAPVEMQGCTIVEVDGDGRVTRWRDYLDRKQPEEQIRAWLRDSG